MDKQDITIESYGRDSLHKPCACWADGDRRYHVWLNRDGTVDEAETLHSNPPLGATREVQGYRPLRLTTKYGQKAVAAIRAAVADGALDRAHVARAARLEADRAESVREGVVRAQAIFNQLWEQNYRYTGDAP